MRILILLVCIVLGCSQADTSEIPDHLRDVENLTVYPADAEPTMTIELTRDQTFGSTDEVPIGTMTGTAVDDAGRVFMGDSDQSVIHVFQPDGRYMTQVGGEGEGPGKFSNFRTMDLQLQSDRLFAYDAQQQRISVFVPDSFTVSKTINVDPQNGDQREELQGTRMGPFFVQEDQTILAGFEKMHEPDDRVILYHRMNNDGEIVSDKILEQKDADIYAGKHGDFRASLILPFSRKTVTDMSNDGRLYSAWTEEFLVEVHDSDGQFSRAFYYPYANTELNREAVINDYPEGNIREVVRNAEFAETWPALNDLLVDDEGRIWVSTIVDDDEVYEWWVLEENGELVAKFTWLRGRELQEVKNGSVYTIETEEETELQQVVRYSIEFTAR